MFRLIATARRALPSPAVRTLSTSTAVLKPTPTLFKDFRRASPPLLPAEDQAEFERLQREAAVAPPTAEARGFEERLEELQHPDMRKGAKPEFEGETNPKTGEVGGPKRDPFGAGNSDWQFGGRVTDF